MICASSWLQSWNDDTSNSLLESTTSDSVQRTRFVHPCQSWPAVYRLMRRAPFILHICRYDSQSFLRIGVLPSPCGASRISHIQPTPLLCPRFQVLVRVDVQNCISMVVIWAFIEIHNVQGYLWSENLDSLVGGTIWMVAAMSTIPALLLCFYCCITWPFGILVHLRIPMWSQLWVNVNLIKIDLVGPRIIQFSGI